MQVVEGRTLSELVSSYNRRRGGSLACRGRSTLKVKQAMPNESEEPSRAKNWMQLIISWMLLRKFWIPLIMIVIHSVASCRRCQGP